MSTLCTVCGTPSVARALCKRHYRAFMKYGDPTARANLRGVPFEHRYRTAGDCWLWIGSVNSDGYGIWNAYGEKRAHRAAWAMHNGPVPAGLHVLHTCDSPGCVNPKHLFLGTHQDNMADLRAKDRAYGAIGTANFGAKLTEAQVLSIMNDHRPASTVAAQYGLSKEMVSNIRTGKNWKHLFDKSFREAREAAGRRRLTEADKAAIFDDPRTQTKIAEAYGISQSRVSVIKRARK